jgi:hypothetical protein
MSIRLSPAGTNGGIRLVLPEGRHLERDGWHVAVDIVNGEPRLLAARVWAPTNSGYRIIVIDRFGSEYESRHVRAYEDAREEVGKITDGEFSHPRVDGRRLVSGGDPDWELAAEIEHLGQEEIIFVRFWLQATQEMDVYALDAAGVVRGHDLASTYRKAHDSIVDHILS